MAQFEFGGVHLGNKIIEGGLVTGPHDHELNKLAATFRLRDQVCHRTYFGVETMPADMSHAWLHRYREPHHSLGLPRQETHP